MAAARHEHHHDVIADRKIGDAFADLGDDARRFMAEHHWRRARPRAVDHREIGMAEPGRHHPDEHFAAPGTIEVDLDDLQRARARIRGLSAHRPQHRRPDPHVARLRPLGDVIAPIARRGQRAAVTPSPRKTGRGLG